ncbi:MAG: hypothetical protein PHO37_15730 [Kiritimatiellae bacterium]|nr:hypothetical protein [Kiritimatiellia bacterium]
MNSAALASSLWIVCRKRPAAARPGWDNRVLEEMRANITDRLREYWDAGIRGPDFVWAATGPALEAYSKHPVVKKANEPGEVMTVGEFLVHVRRMVVDFVVGQVMSGAKDGDMAAADRMDSPTAYYLLHRHDFGLEDAPAGACILYATACGISDRDLEVTWDLIATKGGSAPAVKDADDDDSAEDGEESEDSSGPASILGEPIPAGVLNEKATLRSPPATITAAEIMPENLPDTWENEQTTALAVAVALSLKSGQTLPWKTVRDVITASLTARFTALDSTGGAWPCEYNAAQSIKLKIPAHGDNSGMAYS